MIRVLLVATPFVFADGLSEPNKVFLRSQTDKAICAFSSSGHEGDVEVVARNCNDVVFSDLTSTLFEWAGDGRIRSSGGLCLLGDKHNNVYFDQCYGDLEDIAVSKWLNMNGRIQNAANDQCLTAREGRLSTSECKDAPDSTEFLSITPFNEDTYKLEKAKYHSTVQYKNAIQFRQLHRTLLGTNSVVDGLKAVQEWIIRRLTWSSSVSKDVQDKLNEQEKHLLKLPSETAQNGLYCEVYDNAGLEGHRVGEFIIKRFAITPDMIHKNINMVIGGTSIRLQGFVSVPADGTWYFKASGANAGTRMYLNGKKIMDSWTAPLGGSLTSNGVALRSNEKYAISFEMFANAGKPNAVLYWKGPNVFSYQEVPIQYLSPDFNREFCPREQLEKIDCKTPFAQLSLSEGESSTRVMCPSGCLATYGATTYGGDDCYSLSSSVCVAGIHSGVLPESGGVMSVVVDNQPNALHTLGAPGF